MKIKNAPEDFIVEEIPDIKIETIGDFAVFKLWKRNITTEDAINIICERFHISRKSIKYAGNKDKNAVTTQYISISKSRGDIGIDGKDLKLSFIGYSNEPLSLGTLKGNKFIIRIRDISPEERQRFNMRSSGMTLIPNYYDEQRFSTNNFDIGKNILKKDFKNATALILQSQGNYENRLKSYIEEHPTDYIGALKTIPQKISSIYIHSVQSKIFNDALAMKLRQYATENNIKIIEQEYSLGKMIFYDDPLYYGTANIQELELPGFDSIFSSDYKRVMKDLGLEWLEPKDFIIRAIPDLSVEKSLRTSMVEVESLKNQESTVMGNDIVLEFYLKKGSYATILIKTLFS